MQPGLVTVTCLILLMALQPLGNPLAAYQPSGKELLFEGVPEPESLPRSADGLSLEMVREYGDLDEGLVFGNIVDLTVSETGILAVVDGFDCQIWIVDTETGEGRTIGGCGDGPGEFRQAMTATFRGDTLLVWDMARASIVKLTLDGEEIERARLSSFEMGTALFSDLHVGRDGSILAGLILLPHMLTSQHQQLAIFEEFGGSVVRKELASPPLARRTPRQIARSISVCVASPDEDREVVLALNAWGPQAVFLRRRDLEPIRSVRIPLDWVRTEEHSLRSGYWGPMTPRPRAACGDRFAVAGYRDQFLGPDGETIAVSSAAMVVFDFREESMTVLGGDDPPEPGSVLFMTPAAATGNRFFFFTNGFFDYPVVREYRMVRSGMEP